MAEAPPMTAGERAEFARQTALDVLREDDDLLQQLGEGLLECVAPYAVDWPLGRVRFINPDTGKPGMAPKAGHVAALYLPDWLRSGNGGR